MDFYLFFIYLFAGIVTFFASCAFILVPPFLGVIGRSIQSSPDGATDARSAILKSTIFYVLGFSLVFVLLGIGLGFVGKILLFQEVIQRVGGVVLVLLGLVMIGVFKSSFFSKNLAIRLPSKLSIYKNFNAFLLGGIFAIGWSPCTSPLLGSILVLTSYSGTIFKGIIFLSAFSFGVSLPFIFVALFFGQFSKFFEKAERFSRSIFNFSAIFLIAIGILIASGKFYTIAEYFF